jgi:hypothetical protein
MSSNVGLSTPRGSGTSGYVQRNLALLRHRDGPKPGFQNANEQDFKHRQRQPDKEILEHDRKREVEVKVFELRDKLEEQEYVSRTPKSGHGECDADRVCVPESTRKRSRSKPPSSAKNYSKTSKQAATKRTSRA